MERRGLLARLSDVESEIRFTRDKMRDELALMQLQIDSLERRMYMHAEAMRKLLYEGDEVTMRTMLIHEQILDKLSQLRESWDAEDERVRP